MGSPLLEPGEADALLAAVDAGFDDQLALTAELVRFPSTRGQEAAAQAYMAEAMRVRGLEVDHFRIELDRIRSLPGFSPVHVSYDEAYNVVGTHRVARPQGRSLILNGHIEVVPTGPVDMWTTPPFEPRILDGWMHGRGAGDMKSGLAACLAALDALKRAGYAPASEVIVQSVVEEECTGNGALACLERGYRADAVLIPEPMFDQLLSAQIGVIWFQVKVKGVPVHVAYAAEGANAIEAAYRLMGALHGLEHRWNDRRGDHPSHADLAHPINLNIGRIEGGDWASSVPAWCVFDSRIAIYPGQSIDAAKREIEATLREASAQDPFLAANPPEVVYNGFEAEGYVLDLTAPPVGVLAAAHERVFGAALKSYPSTATTDARFFGLYGRMPALVYGPTSELIHGFDERVDLTSLRNVTKAMTLFIADWCGLAPL